MNLNATFHALEVLLFISVLCLSAQEHQLLRVFVENRQQAEQLTRMPLDFATRSIGRYADIVANPEEEMTLRSMGYRIIVLESSATLAKKGAYLGGDMGAYHTYQELVDELTMLATNYPDILLLQSLGKTWEGRTIWAVKISDNPAVEEADEPEVLYIGNIHAREIITPEVVLIFLRTLVQKYGTDPLITEMVQTRQLWLVPMLNPDGHVQVEQGDRWWRKNRRLNEDSSFGVDLNRNFSYKWGYDNIGSSFYMWSDTYRGVAPFSEPESKAIQRLVESHHFVAAMSYHSYGRLCIFPWGYEKLNTPHHEIFLEMSRAMTADNGYEPGNPAMEVIYQTNGDTDDYFYGEQNQKNTIFGFTTEIGATFFPSESDIPKHSAETLPINLYLAQVAGLLAKDPWSILRPEVTNVYTTPADDDGEFRLGWRSDTPPPNAPVYYEIQELVNYRTIVDHASESDSLWAYQLFFRDFRKGFGDLFSYNTRNDSNANASLTMRYPIIPKQGDKLTAKLSYSLWDAHDYLYVRVSQDRGKTFAPLIGNITTNYNPLGNNRGNGITGYSKGWVEGRFDLSAYANKQISIQFFFITDGSGNSGDLLIDDISPVPLIDRSQTLTVSSTDTIFTIQKRIPGNFSFRIRGIDADAQYSDWSDLLFVPVVFGQVGDINRDGQIDNLDVNRCSEIILGVGEAWRNGEIFRANVNGSPENGADAVNVMDLIQLIKRTKIRP